MLVFIGMFVIIFFQLINLQLFSSKYKIMPMTRASFRKVIYPDRGIVFDRKGKSHSAKHHHLRPDGYSRKN